MTIKVWIATRVHNFRHRFHEHSMSTATTSNTISSDDSLIQRYKVRMQALGLTRARMAGVVDDYCTSDTPDEARCGSCKERKGRFVGENCKHAHPYCRYCCFAMVEKGFLDWEGGPVRTFCPICYKEVTVLLRRKKSRSSSDGFDENSSTHEVSMTIAELTEGLIQEGMMNEGFESSGSL